MALATICSISVVFPDDSGPKISTTRPRGTPPIPKARSRVSAPVPMLGTSRAARSSSPSFMIDPSPNCFVIWEIRVSRFPLSVFTSVFFFFAAIIKTPWEVVG